MTNVPTKKVKVPFNADANKQAEIEKASRQIGPGTDINKTKGADKNSATKDPKKGNNLVTKNAVKMLQFPETVESDGQGHYIHFKIHAHAAGNVHSTSKPGLAAQIKGSEGTQKFQQNRGATTGSQRSYYASIAPPRRQLATSIALYMPASVAVSYGANYADTDIGIGTEAAVAAVSEFASSEGTIIDKGFASIKAAANVGIGAAVPQLAKLGDKMGMSGISAMLNIGTGMVSTDRVELEFKRMSRRDFSYSFTLIPQSGQEAQTIQEIVYLFKMHMHPEYTTGYGDTGHLQKTKMGKSLASAVKKETKTVTKSGRFFRIPDTFDIEYMAYGNKNAYIHEISTCFLKNISVTYGGDKFRAYDIQEGMFGEGAPPQTTVINLSFSEIDVLTKASIAKGF